MSVMFFNCFYRRACYRFIVECILEELMSVLPDLFAENTDVDNEHLPANSVCYISYYKIYI